MVRHPRAKVFHECLQGMGAVAADLAVMVPWNGEDGSRVVLVGMIELVVILRVLSLIVDNIPQMVEERRLFRELGGLDLPRHVVGDIFLSAAAADAAGITDHVEGDLTRLLDSSRAVGQNGGEVQMIRCILRPHRRRLKTLAAFAAASGYVRGTRRGRSKEETF